MSIARLLALVSRAPKAAASAVPAVASVTVDSVLADLSKGIARLDKLAEQKAAKAERLDADAAALVEKADAARFESARAERVADRLAQLLA